MNNSRMPAWKIIAVAMLTLGMIAMFTSMNMLDHFTKQAQEYLVYFAAAFILYLIASALIWNVDVAATRSMLISVFAVAVLMRVPLWFTEPSLSTDVWRYLWDGSLLSRGINPYAERVDSPIYDPIETPDRARVQHQWMASPYPPIAQLTFYGVYTAFPGSATAMQVAFTLFDLASGVVLMALLVRLNRPTGRALLYLWNPLIVMEFAHGAHLDSLMTLFVLLALLMAIEQRHNFSLGSLALATLTKYVPAILLPIFIRRWGWRRVILYFLIIVLVLLPFIGGGSGLNTSADGTGIFGAVRIYSTSWKSNDGIFHWLVDTLEIMGVYDALIYAKFIVAILVAAVGLYVYRMVDKDDNQDPDAVICGAVLLISAYLLVSAALFPWYLSWIIALLPLLPVRRWRSWWPFIFAWLYFSGAVNLSYLFYLDPDHPREIEWIRQLEYLPSFVLLGTSFALAVWEQTRDEVRDQIGPKPPGAR